MAPSSGFVEDLLRSGMQIGTLSQNVNFCVKIEYCKFYEKIANRKIKKKIAIVKFFEKIARKSQILRLSQKAKSNESQIGKQNEEIAKHFHPFLRRQSAHFLAFQDLLPDDFVLRKISLARIARQIAFDQIENSAKSGEKLRLAENSDQIGEKSGAGRADAAFDVVQKVESQNEDFFLLRVRENGKQI